ncbi:MAG: hypothetical protein LBC30_00945 [Puniceicoccales bacterium]|nr:hypothetical protein [Puniceicoccales bacterium]
MATASAIRAKEVRPPRRKEERGPSMTEAKKYDVKQLKLDLACSIRSFCLYFLPNGKYSDGELKICSVD